MIYIETVIEPLIDYENTSSLESHGVMLFLDSLFFSESMMLSVDDPYFRTRTTQYRIWG